MIQKSALNFMNGSAPGILYCLLIVLFSLNSCAPEAEKPVPVKEKENPAKFESLPSAVAEVIKAEFPAARPYEDGIDTLVEKLKAFGIPANKMLWGQSTCVDDIINTKNKLNPDIKGPFNFGGLAGLPFTGVSGLDAFAHHVPEDGAAILFVGPHIGYNEKEGWGKILRHDQHHPSSCCGALMGALSKLKKGELKEQEPWQKDYQEGTLEQMAFSNREDILSSKEPLLTFTRIIYHEALKQLTDQASRVRERHFKYAVIIGGIIINTDHTYADHVWIDNISILDISKNEWVFGERPKP